MSQSLGIQCRLSARQRCEWIFEAAPHARWYWITRNCPSAFLCLPRLLPLEFLLVRSCRRFVEKMRHKMKAALCLEQPVSVQEVLRGYVGDRDSKAIFAPDTFMGRAFGLLGDGYQRPFELATVRLKNMIGSLRNCAIQPADLRYCAPNMSSLHECCREGIVGGRSAGSKDLWYVCRERSGTHRHTAAGATGR